MSHATTSTRFTEHRTRARAVLPSVLGMLVAAAFGHAPADAHAQQGARPNIVVVTTDDQALNTLRGRYMPATVKQIADKGTTFTNAIVTTPLCCPSRATLLTGQYAHNHGVLQNAYGLLSDKQNVLPAWLQRAGYRTAHVGKFLNGYERAVGSAAEVAPGWDIWFTTLGATRYFDYDVSANGRMRHFGKGPRSHVTRLINRKAATVVRRYAPEREPLYLQVDHRAPHTETGVNSGGGCGARAIPETTEDKSRLRDEPLPIPPSFNEADVSDKPSFVRSRPLLSEGRLTKITKRFTCAAGALQSVDRGIARIIKALKRIDELDDTVLVFTSDNGFYFGEHRIARDKTQPYEEAIRVPLLVRTPKRFRGGGRVGSKVDEPGANIDLAPTFLDLARGRPCTVSGECRVMDGRSLVPLLRDGGAWPHGRALLTEYDGAGSKGISSCEYQGIRAQGWFYVEHLRVPNPLTGACEEAEEVELYNLVQDPFQLQSRPTTGDPIAAQLRARLDRLRDCAGIVGRDPAPAQGSYCE